ncbi:MAG: CDP-alcohol phosphatidyltransferase family protein [bacterium]|nr:CDP-alcohol phosphatidyltransferase family protein [bacterium]
MERQASKDLIKVPHSPVASRTLEGVLGVGHRFVIRPLTQLVPAWITPNSLSALRLILSGVLAGLLWRELYPLAAVIYGIALLTDALDGELARLRAQGTRFGARFDPSVDKVLHGVLFVYFWVEAPVLLALLLLFDLGLFLVGLVLVTVAKDTSRNLSASIYGRWKMIFQALGCSLLLWNVMLPSLPFPRPVVITTLSLALAFAVLSMWGYLQRFMQPRSAHKEKSLSP